MRSRRGSVDLGSDQASRSRDTGVVAIDLLLSGLGGGDAAVAISKKDTPVYHADAHLAL